MSNTVDFGVSRLRAVSPASWFDAIDHHRRPQGLCTAARAAAAAPPRSPMRNAIAQAALGPPSHSDCTPSTIRFNEDAASRSPNRNDKTDTDAYEAYDAEGAEGAHKGGGGADDNLVFAARVPRRASSAPLRVRPRGAALYDDAVRAHLAKRQWAAVERTRQALLESARIERDCPFRPLLSPYAQRIERPAELSPQNRARGELIRRREWVALRQREGIARELAGCTFRPLTLRAATLRSSALVHDSHVFSALHERGAERALFRDDVRPRAAAQLEQRIGHRAPLSADCDVDAVVERLFARGAVRCAAINETKRCAAMDETKRCAAMVETKRCAAMDETKRCAAMVETKRCAAMVETKRCAAMDETKRCAAMDETKRCAAMAETKRCAAMDETKRCAAMVEEKRCAAMVETKRCAAMDETKRCAAMDETKRCAAMAETKRCAAMVEEKRFAALCDGALRALLERERLQSVNSAHFAPASRPPPSALCPPAPSALCPPAPSALPIAGRGGGRAASVAAARERRALRLRDEAAAAECARDEAERRECTFRPAPRRRIPAECLPHHSVAVRTTRAVALRRAHSQRAAQCAEGRPAAEGRGEEHSGLRTQAARVEPRDAPDEAAKRGEDERRDAGDERPRLYSDGLSELAAFGAGGALTDFGRELILRQLREFREQREYKQSIA